MKSIVAALFLSATPAFLPAPAGAFEGESVASVHKAALGKGVLPRAGVERIVHGEGYAEISGIDLDRGLYRVEAVRSNGAVFLLTLDAQDGALVATERRGWARASHEGPRPHRHPGTEFRFDF